uniref:Radical SAM protein n=1 Tax=Candidatus Desulfatibia profunda TaxID=2841695 RepID=A0A8J6NUP4_9BACT|nr:radical SAM protein [Candidatus Desulfatibia profunda]
MADQETCYPLTSLYLYLTDRCNLSCSHCWISPEFSQLRQNGIPLDSLKKTISEAGALGLGSVKLTGGEPLLYRQLDELLIFLKSKELTIYIETNGTLIDQKMIKSFQAAGVEQISVSLDAATEEIHNKIRGIKGSYALTMQGLHRLSGSGLQFQIIMTLQRKNRGEIPAMILLSKKLGACSLKINHLLPCGRGKDVFDQKENLDLDELTQLYRLVEEEWPRPDTIEIEFDLPVALRSIEDIKRRGLNECRILNILGILANGDFSICGIGQTVEELRMGNLLHDSVTEVWHNNPILIELRQSITSRLKGACGGCIFKFQCLGGCRANAYFLTKDLHAPYFLCQQYYESGLFPSSRYIG